MTTDELTEDDERDRRTNDGSNRRAVTRRAVLASAVAAGATAGCLGEAGPLAGGDETPTSTATTSRTDTPTPPPAPTNLELRQGVGRSIDVFWDGPPDPCSTTIEHYVVSVDGTDRKAVQPGVNAANVTVENGHRQVSVRAVDEYANKSYKRRGHLDIRYSEIRFRLVPKYYPKTIRVGETLEASLSLRKVMTHVEFPSEISYDVTLGVSTPCVAAITDASPLAGDGTATSARTESPTDDTTGRIAVSNRTTDDYAGWITLGSVTITGRSPGATRLAVRSQSVSGISSLREGWNTVTVVPEDAPTETDEV